MEQNRSCCNVDRAEMAAGESFCALEIRALERAGAAGLPRFCARAATGVF